MSAQDLSLAKWRPGVVDEWWKRRVVLDERSNAIRTINGLGVILFGSTFPGVPVTDFEGQCNVLRGLSGDQIADQLIAYWRNVARELEQSKGLTDPNAVNCAVPAPRD